MVATPFCTVTLNRSAPTFDFTSLARIAVRICPSVELTIFLVAAVDAVAAWPGPAKAASTSAQRMILTLIEAYTRNAPQRYCPGAGRVIRAR